MPQTNGWSPSQKLPYLHNSTTKSSPILCKFCKPPNTNTPCRSHNACTCMRLETVHRKWMINTHLLFYILNEMNSILHATDSIIFVHVYPPLPCRWNIAFDCISYAVRVVHTHQHYIRFLYWMELNNKNKYKNNNEKVENVLNLQFSSSRDFIQCWRIST